MNARFVYLRKPDSSVPDRIEGIRMMARMLDELGIDRKRCRSVSMTQATGKRQPNAKDIEAGKEQFLKDMGEEPVIIVLMGSKVVNAISKKITMDCCRGEPVPIDDTMPYPKGSLLYCMFDPSVLMSDPGKEDLFQRDVRHLASLMNGTPEVNPPVDNILVHGPGELDAFTSLLPGIWETLPPDERFLVVDCEWHGKNWMEPGHYIRTVQIGYAPGKAITVELYRENPAFDDPDHEWPRKSADRKAEIRRLLDEPQSVCTNIIGMWKSLKKLLQDSGLPIIGHNIIADWQWLLTFGVDIRNNVVYDTMLAEHLINSDGPFRLDEVAIRRTKFGRYCMDVDMWVHNHREFCQEGYGAVPHRMILPYGGCDVECPRQIMHAQYPILKEYGMMNPRGPNGEYPSLLDSTLLNQLATDEFERNGLPVDRERLTSLIDSYQGMRSQLLSQITLMAMKEGMAEFNPNSQPQMRELLFGKLGLTPVKTTGGQNWGDTVGRYEMDSEDMPASSTDKSVLEMLQNEHPLVKKMLQFRRIDQACKTWLRHPDEDGEGGLESQLWSDGKLHPSFLPLTSTGRYKTSNPNCAPREVEVLTSRGWMHWDEAYANKDDESLLIAQWEMETEDHEITFARPIEWCHSEGEVIRFHTHRHIDILCTPNHRFEIYGRNGRHKCVTAEELSSNPDYTLPQSGMLSDLAPGKHLSDAEVSLLCATQADGHVVKSKYKGVSTEFGVEYALTKERKSERIKKALTEAGIKFRESHDLNAIGNPRSRFYVEKKLSEKAFASFKKFDRRLLDFDADTIRRLSDEVFLWDGTVRDSWSNYASAIRENSDWVQILQILSGKRARPRVCISKIGSVSYQIDAVRRKNTTLANGEIERLPGKREVFCATMPLGTLIMRYNGKVVFTRNSQNFPKKADGYLKEIFGEDNVPPMLRTIVAPPEGWMMMEGDFCQAELFTMANISGDENMIRLLTTPGLDLHDSTTLSSFGMKMIDENDNEVTEDDLVALAARIGAGSDEFQHYMKAMRYLQMDGRIITRSEFKSGPRISAKSLNFGQ